MQDTSTVWAGPGKGLAVYFKEHLFHHVTDITEDNMHLTKMGTDNLDVITLYRSSNGNLSNLIDHLKSLISQYRTTVVCGDLNLCYIDTRRNKVTQWLENEGFKQMVKRATHIRGRLIDHFYIRKANDNITTTVFRHSPFFSDHDAICATLKLEVNS